VRAGIDLERGIVVPELGELSQVERKKCRNRARGFVLVDVSELV